MGSCSSSQNDNDQSPYDINAPDSQLNDEEENIEQAKQIEITGKIKVSLQDFEFIKVLGRGAFGKVMLVMHKPSTQIYAMKIVRKDIIDKRNMKKQAQNERAIMGDISHPFIVQLHYAFQTQQKLYLIMDFMIGGELFFHLRRAHHFQEDMMKFYAAEVVLALEHLHKMGIIYRDLKPENIMIGADGHLKITDFGLSKTHLKEGDITHTFCGTPEYLAPEIYQNLGHNHSADWYSLVKTYQFNNKGAIMYEMLSGRAPFFNKDKRLMLDQRLKKPIEMLPYFSPDSISIISHLLQNDPKNRLGQNGAQEVKQHRFFAEINWDLFAQKQIDPPFKPKIFNDQDLRNFDKMFTEELVYDTPIIQNIKQNDQYQQFSYYKKSEIGEEDEVEEKSTADQFLIMNERFSIIQNEL